MPAHAMNHFTILTKDVAATQDFLPHEIGRAFLLAAAAVAFASFQVYQREGKLFFSLHLTNVNDLKALRRGSPVRLRGVVTYHDSGSHVVYLQDPTGACRQVAVELGLRRVRAVDHTLVQIGGPQPPDPAREHHVVAVMHL